jgi:hypothetical protein
MNEKIGRAAVRYAARYLRHRYRREIRIGAGIAVVATAVAVAGFLSRRDVPEG